MTTQRYYDEFSHGYDRSRAQPYHALLDQLEIEVVAPLLPGAEVLDVASGTGLLQLAFAERARHAIGVDLSRGMLSSAHRRHLTAIQASADALPFPADSFDLVTCFKAFPHMGEPETVLSELTRVVRPGGHVALEIYNATSLRGLLRRHGPKRAVSARLHEGHVPTRFDTPDRVSRMAPPSLRLRSLHPIRVLLPSAWLLRVPGIGWGLSRLERRIARLQATYRVAGFVVLLFERTRA